MILKKGDEIIGVGPTLSEDTLDQMDQLRTIIMTESMTEYKFNPQWEGDKAPLDYKGTLPFDRFGPNGHRYYHKGSHTNRFGHFCPEWDYMWICSDCKEFQACKCFETPDLNNEVEWFRDILPHMIEIEELCAARGFPFEWKVGMPHIELTGKVNEDRTVKHDNKEK